MSIDLFTIKMHKMHYDLLKKIKETCIAFSDCPINTKYYPTIFCTFTILFSSFKKYEVFLLGHGTLNIYSTGKARMLRNRGFVVLRWHFPCHKEQYSFMQRRQNFFAFTCIGIIFRNKQKQ